ncbi:acyl-CoA thioesterase [Haloplasma contractile]|uniref:Uncharacterized protein n=1 Tax=Haloplasma contractile SSD-17B TaxID=1033810 RepID=U2FE01_9MOLU|nr:acyl-CoA thioesterase [Haloplasma contractile]ERJ11205.1 4-hydroxybenzoyl-CoA thioesterase putative protein [Haloplasma contractile SSD-17B]
MISSREIEVRYSETDQMGVVYHANYLTWFELGRTKFFQDLGYHIMDLEQKGIIFPVREINIEYLTACRYGEVIIVETSVKKFSKIKTVYQHVIKNKDGELKARGESTVVCVQKDNFSLAKIDKVAPDVYEVYKNVTTTKSS